MLLEELEGEPNRNAYFVCCLVAISDVDRVITVAERWDGEIATEPSNASGGFGYDPVFFLPERNCTAADLSPNEKNRLSHRGRAAAVIKPALAAAING
jgi:XTP/dITP diphosphohydrolase